MHLSWCRNHVILFYGTIRSSTHNKRSPCSWIHWASQSKTSKHVWKRQGKDRCSNLTLLTFQLVIRYSHYPLKIDLQMDLMDCLCGLWKAENASQYMSTFTHQYIDGGGCCTGCQLAKNKVTYKTVKFCV